MIKPKEISHLFYSVNKTISHQQEIERLKGEKFNLFSVLRIERRENKTHSAFLSELLSPEGSHQKGHIFLELFLRHTNLSSFICPKTSFVSLEYYIGPRNDADKNGGRLDILIRDKHNKTLCIENKIDAGDQYAQIERYFNFNKENNKVIYLTLNGKEPGSDSRGTLIGQEDFYLLSYKDDIRSWLEQCLKEAVDAPMLRESIKQYIKLIEKMTNTADNQHEGELIELVMKNYEAAAYVTGAFNKARLRIADDVRYTVLEELKTGLPGDLTAGITEKIENRYAQIWVWHKDYPKAQMYFGIESFNGTGNHRGDLFMGIFNPDGKPNAFTEKRELTAKHWHFEQFLLFDGARINFGNDSLIANIQNSPVFKQSLIEHITREFIDFILLHEEEIKVFLEATK